MIKLKHLAACLWVISATFLFFAPIVQADVNDFVITNFNARYELFNDVHGGRMRAEEQIDLVFSDNNHGILRAIPSEYKGNSLELRVLDIKRDGGDEPFTTYSQNNNEVLKIGDPNKTITGAHTYNITYEITNVISFYEGYSEWFWDINGDQWQQTFESVSGEVIFPIGWQENSTRQAKCFTGTFGMTESSCSIEKTTRGYKFSALRPLAANETLTIAAAAPEGLFAPRTAADWWQENASQVAGLAVGLLCSIYVLNIWRKHGKDYKGRGVIIPEYEAPKSLTPAEVGLLMDYNLDGRDLTATIIDLAVRGYIKIHDQETKKWGLFKTHEFSLELTKNDTTTLKPHEQKILKALFGEMSAGEIKEISKINRQTMYSSTKSIKDEMTKGLTDQYGLFESSASKQKGLLVGVAVAASVMAFIISPGWGWVLGSIMVLISSLIALLLLRRRSHAGVAAYEKVQGLKLYMKTAEAERLAKLQSVDRPYAPPEKTAHLFEKLLPFAVALGVERSWAKQFEGIYTQPPNWYSGNYSAFHMTAFASDLSRGVGALTTSFTPPSNSGSSGISGGGFSGGGGGGGGGGGW